MNSRIIVQLLFFAVSFYCFGAAMMDSIVVYHGWRFVGPNEFALVHEETGKRIVQVLVYETLLMTILTVMMFWKKPNYIPKKWIAAAFGFELISWISSVFIQIPIQLSMKDKNVTELERLISTDWIRTIASIIYILIVSRILYEILKRNNFKERLQQLS